MGGVNKSIYCVYRHVRPDKGEVFYIGIGDEKRPYEKTGRNRYWNSIMKLNPTYEVEILIDNLTWEQCCEKEKEFIKLYGRSDLKLGTLCNLTDGGDGVTGILSSEETRRKLSIANIKSKVGLSKPFSQVSLKGEIIEKHKSLRAATIKTKIAKSDISLVCRGLSKTAGGFIWIYESEIHRLNEIVEKVGGNIRDKVAVNQLTKNGEFIRIWESMYSIEKELGIGKTSVSAVCRGVKSKKTAGGFIWEYCKN